MAERKEAVAQIQRSLKAWRSASKPAAQGEIPRGTGTPIATDVRKRMEPKLGADLSQVRVHTGGESEAAARGFGARAFTVGMTFTSTKASFRQAPKKAIGCWRTS